MRLGKDYGVAWVFIYIYKTLFGIIWKGSEAEGGFGLVW